jgi:hypothetical protein
LVPVPQSKFERRNIGLGTTACHAGTVHQGRLKGAELAVILHVGALIRPPP